MPDNFQTRRDQGSRRFIDDGNFGAGNRGLDIREERGGRNKKKRLMGDLSRV